LFDIKEERRKRKKRRESFKSCEITAVNKQIINEADAPQKSRGVEK